MAGPEKKTFYQKSAPKKNHDHHGHKHEHSHDKKPQAKTKQEAKKRLEKAKKIKQTPHQLARKKLMSKLDLKQVQNKLKPKFKHFAYIDPTKKGPDSVNLEAVKKNAATIAPNTVLELQRKRPNILFEVFADVLVPDKSWRFNCRGNSMMNAKIGLVDFFRYRPDVKAIERKSAKRGIVRGERDGGYGNFYSPNYVSILDGDDFTITAKRSKAEVQQMEKRYQQNLKKNATLLAKNMPKKWGVLLPPQTIKVINSEATRQNVDPKLLIARIVSKRLASGGFGNHKFGIDLSELRWKSTDLRNNQRNYEKLSNKKSRDQNGNYTLGFLSFMAHRERDNFGVLQKSYQQVAGQKLTGTAKDIADARKLAKVSFGSKEVALTAALAQHPKLRNSWNKVKSILLKNGIKPEQMDDEMQQDGLALITLGKKAVEYLSGSKGAQTIKLMKALITKGWKFNLRNLAALYDFMNGETNDGAMQKYRNANLPKILKQGPGGVDLTQALDLISKMPKKHYVLDCIPHRRRIGDYALRKKIMRNGRVIAYAGWHSGLDIGGTFDLTAPTNGRLYAVNYMKGSGGNSIIFQFKDRDGSTVRMSFCHLKDTPKFQEMLARYRKGDRYIRAGEMLGTTGTTGNSTGVHLHLTVRKNGRIVDPIDWVPEHTKRTLMNQRNDPRDAWKYDPNNLRAKSGSRGLPKGCGHAHH